MIHASTVLLLRFRRNKNLPRLLSLQLQVKMEPDETTMMEPPAAATVALKNNNGKRPLAQEQEAVNSQGATKRANKGKAK
jgi:hypothetical protein